MPVPSRRLYPLPSPPRSPYWGTRCTPQDAVRAQVKVRRIAARLAALSIRIEEYRKRWGWC